DPYFTSYGLKQTCRGLRVPQEAVNDIIRVSIVSRDRPCWVIAVGNGTLESASARAWSVERRKSAVVSAHEAVTHIARVNVVSRDRPLRVDVEAEDRGKGTLAVASARARSVERGERAIRSPQEAMTHIAVVSVVSRDGACRVNATVAEGALRKRSCACTRSIKHSETAVSSAHVGRSEERRVGKECRRRRRGSR